MKIIITGGAGFIGSNLAEELSKEKDNEVIIVDDLSTGNIGNIAKHFDQTFLKFEFDIEFVKGSVTDLDLLNRIFKDADYVFHQAAIPSVQRSIEDPVRTNEVNVKGTLNVLSAARDGGVKKVIYASSSSVYGDTPELPKREDMNSNPKSPYAVSKLTGEYYCNVFNEVYGLKTISLRYFNVYGPKQDPSSEYAAVIPRFITRVLENKPPIIYGDGNQTRDFTFVNDVAQANIRAMEKNVEGVFNIACGERISIKELATTIMEIVGARLDLVYDKPRPGDIKDSLADVSLAKGKLNYRPKFNLIEGLEETIQWFQKDGF